MYSRTKIGKSLNITLSFFLVLFLAQSAVTDDNVVLTIGDVEACPDFEVSVPVVVNSGFSGVSVLNIQIFLDTLHITEVNVIDIHPSIQNAQFNYFSGANLLLLSWFDVSSTASVPPDSELFVITGIFQGGQTELSFLPEHTYFMDDDSEPLPVALNNGSLTPILHLLQHPEDVEVEAGEDASFTVLADPAAPPTVYQWQKLLEGSWFDLPDELPYSGSTTADLTISNVGLEEHQSTFRVRVERDGCVMVSDPATLFLANQPELFNLRLDTKPVDGGTTSGCGLYEEGQEVSIHASPSTGYSFLHWMLNDELFSQEASHDFLMPDNNLTIIAHFTISVYTLTYTAGDNGSLMGDTQQQVEHGGDGTPVEAVANEGHHFVEWSDGVSDNPRTDTGMTGSLEVTAHFAIKTNPSITFEVKDPDGNPLQEAVITLNETIVNEPGDYVFANLEPGEYHYSVVLLCYMIQEGFVNLAHDDLLKRIDLEGFSGDVNGDGLVDVSDVMLIVDYVFGNTPTSFCLLNADVNGDGVVDISDIMLTVDMIFSTREGF